MDQRIVAGLRRLESIRVKFGETIVQRIDQAIKEAERLAKRVRLCPNCNEVMSRDGTMYTCPGCGLCRDDSDEPTADFSPPDAVEQDVTG